MYKSVHRNHDNIQTAGQIAAGHISECPDVTSTNSFVLIPAFDMGT